MHPTAQDRLADLLDTPAKPAEAGYLDVLGDAPQAGPTTGLTQRVMRTNLLPRIYENYWRPAFGRLFLGPFGPSMAGEIRLAVELLALRPGQLALDVACGTGRFTRAFGEAVGTEGLAIGLDGAPSMLTRAVAETPDPANVAYLRADAVEPPFPPSTVDAICCFAALHMLAEPERALDSFARILRPGGRLVLLTSARRDWQPARIADTVGGILSGQRMFDRGEIAAALRARGFLVVAERFPGVTQIVAGKLPDEN
ncbi:class I SAM-dependent methyltransferase [Amycolatopsis sp. NPDC051903]|uniref:class I SAM-dependent methyltransferase n=1 Tax=Amycolatopsis sp. NPDC051903 TaxID=3363936 RepID=UPI00379466C2